MAGDIQGLHHITAMAANARRTDRFYTRALGLRRVKQTVNFDAPEVYHLYYGDETGAPGSIITFFPFPRMARAAPGVGEASLTAYAVPPGSLLFWRERLARAGSVFQADTLFGEPRLLLSGPDGEAIALVETADPRAPFTGNGVGAESAIRGFHSVTLRLRRTEATADLLRLLGYQDAGADGPVQRFRIPGNGADIIDLVTDPALPMTSGGAGAVHHVAFAAPDRAAQARVHALLAENGQRVTPVIDRDYFWAIYFRASSGVLFEVATAEPGFARDEAPDHLGEALQLPAQHEHLRAALREHLEPLDG